MANQSEGMSNKGFISLLFGAVAVVGGSIAAYKSYDSVPIGSYGLRVTSGEIVKDADGSPKLFSEGYYLKRPVLDSFYSFNNNTIIMTAAAGSGNNAQDQNGLQATMRLHYQIDPKVGKMSVHLDSMGSDNGKTLLTNLMDQSVNAVVGSRPATESLNDFQGFFKAFLDNLQFRIAQNNVPIRLDRIELLDLRGSIRKPIQFMIKPSGEIMPMAGLAVPSLSAQPSPAAPR